MAYFSVSKKTINKQGRFLSVYVYFEKLYNFKQQQQQQHTFYYG